MQRAEKADKESDNGQNREHVAALDAFQYDPVNSEGERLTIDQYRRLRRGP